MTIRHPHLTADLPGCGGRIRLEPEDFEVEEIPAYEACGHGEHLYLHIEKRSVGAGYFLNLLAKKLASNPRELGVAGLKDRHAVTRQWVSCPQSAESRLNQIDGDGLKLLAVTRHTNKLRSGHLKGNRFRILIRDADRHCHVVPILERIRAEGLPNYYGPQRFGHEGATAQQGMALLREPERAKRLDRFRRKLYLSAAQSFLFNEVLARRHRDGLLRTVLDGDVMMKWPAGGLFIANDTATEQRRFDAREIVTGGPMFGVKTFAAKSVAAERESAVLSDHDLSVDSFVGFGPLLSGTRRHNLIYLDDLTAAWEPEGLRLMFTLPAGSYATVLLAEVMKSDAAQMVSDGDCENE